MQEHAGDRDRATSSAGLASM